MLKKLLQMWNKTIWIFVTNILLNHSITQYLYMQGTVCLNCLHTINLKESFEWLSILFDQSIDFSVCQRRFKIQFSINVDTGNTYTTKESYVIKTSTDLVNITICVLGEGYCVPAYWKYVYLACNYNGMELGVMEKRCFWLANGY